MDLHELEYIVEIARQGNITKAAETLNISQPTLSIFLKRLEARLNFSVFIRDGRRLTPTPQGHLYLDACQKILSIRDQAYSQIYDSMKGVIHVGVVNSKVDQLCSAVIEFKKKYPDYQIIPLLDTSDVLYGNILDGTLDFAFTTSYIENPDTIYPNVSVKKICSYELCLYVSNQYQDIADSVGHNHVITEKTRDLLNEFSYVSAQMPMIHNRIFNDIFFTYDFHPHLAAESNSDSVAYAITMLYLEKRFCILPETKVPKGVLRLTFPDHPSIYSVLLQQKSKLLTARQQEFISMLSDQLNKEKYYYKL